MRKIDRDAFYIPPEQALLLLVQKLKQNTDNSPSNIKQFEEIFKLIIKETKFFNKSNPLVLNGAASAHDTIENANHREDFLRYIRKCHTSLYFCISELCHILQGNNTENDKYLVKVIEKLFASFGLLFETNDKYWAKVVRYYGDIEQREKRLKNLEVQKIIGANVRHYGMNKTAQYKTEASASLDISNLEAMGLSHREIRQKMLAEYEKKKAEDYLGLKNKAKGEALSQFMENGMELVNSNFNLMADSDLRALKIQKKKEFDEKVQKCLDSIHQYDNEFIDTMFEPRVIMEVTNRVYEKMITASDKTVKSLNLMIKKLGSHDIIESNTINELKALADEMENNRPTQSLALQKVDGNLLKKDYVDELMEHAEDGLMDSIRKNNRKIALKAIQVFKDIQLENQKDMSIQTDTSQQVQQLTQELNDLKKDLSKRERLMKSKHEIDSRRTKEKTKKLALELQLKGELCDQLNNQVLRLQNEVDDLKRSNQDFKHGYIKAKQESEEVNEELAITQRKVDRTHIFVDKMKSALDSLVWNLKNCVPIEHLSDKIKEQHSLMIPSHQIHLEEVSLLKGEGMIDLNIILNTIAKDMGRIVNEDYDGFFATDYKSLMGNRIKIETVDFEDIWERNHEEMLDRIKKKTENLKTQITMANEKNRKKSTSQIDKYLASQKGGISNSKKSYKSKYNKMGTYASKNSRTNSVISPSLSRKNTEIKNIGANLKHGVMSQKYIDFNNSRRKSKKMRPGEISDPVHHPYEDFSYPGSAVNLKKKSILIGSQKNIGGHSETTNEGLNHDFLKKIQMKQQEESREGELIQNNNKSKKKGKSKGKKSKSKTKVKSSKKNPKLPLGKKSKTPKKVKTEKSKPSKSKNQTTINLSLGPDETNDRSVTEDLVHLSDHKSKKYQSKYDHLEAIQFPDSSNKKQSQSSIVSRIPTEEKVKKVGSGGGKPNIRISKGKNPFIKRSEQKNGHSDDKPEHKDSHENETVTFRQIDEDILNIERNEYSANQRNSQYVRKQTDYQRMQQFPSKNLFDSSRTSLYKVSEDQEDFKSEKLLLLEISTKINQSNIPKLSKSRLQKLVRFLLNGNLLPKDPKFIQAEAFLGGAHEISNFPDSLKEGKTPEFAARCDTNVSNRQSKVQQISNSIQEENEDDIQTYSDSENEKNSLSDVSHYQNEHDEVNDPIKLRDKIKKNIQSTGMGASLTRFTTGFKKIGQKVLKGFQYLFEEDLELSSIGNLDKMSRLFDPQSHDEYLDQLHQRIQLQDAVTPQMRIQYLLDSLAMRVSGQDALLKDIYHGAVSDKFKASQNSYFFSKSPKNDDLYTPGSGQKGFQSMGDDTSQFGRAISEKSGDSSSKRMAKHKFSRTGGNFARNYSKKGILKYNRAPENRDIPQEIWEKMDSEFDPMDDKFINEPDLIINKIIRSFTGLKLPINYPMKKPFLTHTTNTPFYMLNKTNPIKKPPFFPHTKPSYPSKQLIKKKEPYPKNHPSSHPMEGVIPPLNLKRYQIMVKKQVVLYIKNHNKCKGVCNHLKQFYQKLAAIFKNIQNEKGTPMKLNTFKIEKMESVSQFNNRRFSDGSKMSKMSKKSGYLIDIGNGFSKKSKALQKRRSHASLSRSKIEQFNSQNTKQ